MRKITLAAFSSKLFSEWDYEKNHPLTPDDVAKGSEVKYWWKCSKDREHNFQCRISDRAYKNTGCRFCSKTNRKATIKTSLATTHPVLAEEWDHCKNQKSAKEVLAGSSKSFHWICKKDPSHTWKASPLNRTRRNTSCPYCSGRLASSTNNLLLLRPDIAEEWDYDLNSMSPSDILPFSHKKVYWLCKSCKTRWKANPLNRTINRSGCPDCAESHGEKVVRAILTEMSVYHTSQQILPGCGDKCLFRFDFVIWKEDKPIAAIEYHGLQHYRPIDFFGGREGFLRTKERDDIKRRYCRSHGIPLLEIPCTELSRAEQLVEKFLVEFSNGE